METETTPKPSWDSAPNWAKYLAMDSDGKWWWYEKKPTKETFSFDSDGRAARASVRKFYEQWGSTLEKRPKRLSVAAAKEQP